MSRPAIAISYQTGIPTEPFEEFANTLKDQEIVVQWVERPRSGPMMGIEALLPTITFVYIANLYFGEIAREAGKDTYPVLKNAVKKAFAGLTEKAMEYPRIEPLLVGSLGKVDPHYPYSTIFSALVELSNERTVKLLLDKKGNDSDYNAAANAFFEFVLRCQTEGDSVLAEVGVDTRHRGNPITVAFDAETRKIKWIDPFS